MTLLDMSDSYSFQINATYTQDLTMIIYLPSEPDGVVQLPLPVGTNIVFLIPNYRMQRLSCP